jgi:Ni,Fe-hydrogenase III small subunit
MPFGTACCAIEMMAALSSRFDLARFGSEVIRFSPRQADLLIVSGRISIKMMPVLLKIWEQMPEPKWCISMGACASSGGLFDDYAINLDGRPLDRSTAPVGRKWTSCTSLAVNARASRAASMPSAAPFPIFASAPPANGSTSRIQPVSRMSAS